MMNTVVVVEHFDLDRASPEGNAEQVRIHITGKLNAGWTLDGVFEFSNEVYMIFTKQVFVAREQAHADDND
jgi:hypothetical protein